MHRIPSQELGIFSAECLITVLQNAHTTQPPCPLDPLCLSLHYMEIRFRIRCTVMRVLIQISSRLSQRSYSLGKKLTKYIQRRKAQKCSCPSQGNWRGAGTRQRKRREKGANHQKLMWPTKQ